MEVVEAEWLFVDYEGRIAKPLYFLTGRSSMALLTVPEGPRRFWMTRRSQ
jgi:hypothetical protein